MAEAAVSSGVGALLAPAQSAAKNSTNPPISSSNDDVSDGNSSSFSSVFAEQGESTSDLKSTQTVTESRETVSVDDAPAAPDLADTDTFEGGQVLPQIGNPLPVDVEIEESLIAVGVGTEMKAEEADALAFENLIAQNQPLDTSSNQSFVIDPALLNKITQSLQASTSDASSSDDESSDADSLATLDVSLLADVGDVVTVTPVPVAQNPSSDVDVAQQSAAASLDLISLLDRKAKVMDGSKPAEILSADVDAEASIEIDPRLADSLLMKNTKTEFTVSLQDNVDNALLKTTELASAMSSKSSSPMDINALPLWRQQGVQSYASTQPASTSLAIDVPVAKAGWGDAVLDKVMWMSSQKIDSADIALDPADLGPMRVRISTHHDQTTVVFTSQHAQVREALDQASTQLRQSLQNQGFTQVNVDVSGQNAGQQLASQAQADGSGGRSSNQDQSMDEQGVSIERLAMASTDINKLGLIDTFV
jgi:flagellar hook-length control protein FliK